MKDEFKVNYFLELKFSRFSHSRDELATRLNNLKVGLHQIKAILYAFEPGCTEVQVNVYIDSRIKDSQKCTKDNLICHVFDQNDSGRRRLMDLLKTKERRHILGISGE